MALHDVIRQRVIKFRTGRGILQKEFCKIFGMGATNYGRYERGCMNFSFEMLAAICDHYKLDEDYFIRDQENLKSLSIDEEVEQNQHDQQHKHNPPAAATTDLLTVNHRHHAASVNNCRCFFNATKIVNSDLPMWHLLCILSLSAGKNPTAQHHDPLTGG